MKYVIDIPDNEFRNNRHYYDSVYHGTPLSEVLKSTDVRENIYGKPPKPYAPTNLALTCYYDTHYRSK